MNNQMSLAVNHVLAMQQMHGALSRADLVKAAGGSNDAKRKYAWCEYGFPADITYDMLYAMYKRGGIANGVVNKLVDNCWKTAPELIEGDFDDRTKDKTPWETRTKNNVMRRGRFWREFYEADKRRLVGRYSALILQIRDGSNDWAAPVASGQHELIRMIPAWAGAIKPLEYDNDQTSDTYGEVLKWSYKEAATGNVAARELTIHRDRIFILGDWRSDAIGLLDPVYNALISLEKVEGGSGEGFLKNAARQMNLNFDREINLKSVAQMYGVDLDGLKKILDQAADDLNKGNDTLLVTQGAQVNPMTSVVPDPQPTYEINLSTVSAGVDIPSKIIVGMQTGERASSEDQKYFDKRCQGRRVNTLSYEVQDLAGHLIRVGVIEPIAEFSVLWDDLSESTVSEKVANAKGMSDTNAVAIASGETIFTVEEIRAVAGYPAVPEEGTLLGEDLPEDEEDEEEEEDVVPAPDPEEVV